MIEIEHLRTIEHLRNEIAVLHRRLFEAEARSVCESRESREELEEANEIIETLSETCEELTNALEACGGTGW